MCARAVCARRESHPCPHVPQPRAHACAARAAAPAPAPEMTLDPSHSSTSGSGKRFRCPVCANQHPSPNRFPRTPRGGAHSHTCTITCNTPIHRCPRSASSIPPTVSRVSFAQPDPDPTSPSPALLPAPTLLSQAAEARPERRRPPLPTAPRTPPPPPLCVVLRSRRVCCSLPCSRGGPAGPRALAARPGLERLSRGRCRAPRTRPPAQAASHCPR